MLFFNIWPRVSRVIGPESQASGNTELLAPFAGRLFARIIASKTLSPAFDDGRSGCHHFAMMVLIDKGDARCYC